jgi:hypothetical protein
MKSWTQNVGRDEIIGKIIYRNVKWSLLQEPKDRYNNEIHASETKSINLKVIYD